MVRVNHPPGGETKFDSENKREPQTVRVLKPPGGGSSISFGFDEKKTNEAETPDQQTPEASTPVSEPSTPEVKPETPKEEQVSTPPPPETPKHSDSNGMSNGSPDPVSSPKPESPPQINSDVTPNKNNETVSSDNDKLCSNNTPESKDSHAGTVETLAETTSLKESATTETHAATDVSEVATATEISVGNSTTVVTNGTHDNTAESKENVSSASNGHKEGKKSPLPPLSIPQSESSSENSSGSPLTPCTPPVKSNEDTKGRVIGSAEEISVSQTPQTRKVKDHMRSNIFMSDEDYTPSRSSRMNATVHDSSQSTPAAGQRQRIPPGGFSTKLW